MVNLPLPAYCGNDETEVTATGMADGTTAQSRDTAIDDALRQAVQQGMGTFVSTETLVENMILIEDRIYSETRGYIKSYEIIKENKSDGAYQVKISAIVKLSKLADDLESIGLLIRKKQNPRVMVLVYSTEVSGSYLGFNREGSMNLENQIEGSLARKGFRIVDAGQVSHKKNVESALQGNDMAGAARVAKDFGAEMLITGEVRREYVDTRQLYGMKVRFFTNEVRLKALETDTAKVLYSGYKTQPPSGVNHLEPLEEASAELIEEMVSGILQQWSKDVYQIASYELNVSGASYKDLSSLKKELKNIRGIGGVQTRSFQSGKAVLEVKYKGSLEELADRVSQLKKPVFEIMGLQSNSIDMKVAAE
ncbi:MAG: hypothetical protein AMK71_08230 [Nitrospira bacterium SG8_35_4]|nr:MAG: hypothetical protein AMK71_08230 [Nitrospira bacterium SG8_35_4]